MSKVYKISALSLAILLAACGGGGSDGYYNEGSGTGSNPGTGEQVKAVNIGAVQLFDLNGTLTQVITSEGVTAKVKVTDQAGRGISGALVTFNATGGVVLGSANGAVLTNVEGEATISIAPESTELNGAYKLSAVAEYDGTSATSKDTLFSLQALQVVLSSLNIAEPVLASGASTNVSLKTTNQSGLIQNNVSVKFSASCGTFEPETVVSSNQGDVISAYKAISAADELCEGPVRISASLPNSNVTTSATIDVTPIQADALVYTTEGAVDLGIKGSGSATSGQIEFTLYANGVPAKDKEVRVSIQKAPADLSFVSLNNRAPQVIKSDPNGKVRVNLYPGDLPGPVEIQATLVSEPSVYALSKNVKVSTGRATQNGLSVSVEKNVLRNDADGDTSRITVRLVDRTGNPVPNGTVVSFVSEGGRVDSHCSTNNGQCNVTLSTQNPRPLDGRVSVLAYVEGDKSYQDRDGDNLYTAGVDVLTQNIGDVFRDDNENNKHDVGEFIYQKAAGVLTCAVSTLTQPTIENTCNNELSAVLRHQLIFGFAEDTPTVVWGSGVIGQNQVSGNGSFDFQLFGNTQRRVPMPSGTLVSVETKDNTPENMKSCEAEIRMGYETVPGNINLSGDLSGETHYRVHVRNCAISDDIKVKTQVPGAQLTTLWLGVYTLN